MKRFHLLVLLACTLGTGASAEIKVTPAEIDLGRRRQELTVETAVTLTNVGKTTETIAQVGADCSCTAATPSETTLKPGQSTQMKVTFATHVSQGEVHRRITVLLGTGQEITIPLRALVSAYDDWSFGSSVALVPPTNKGQEGKTNFAIMYSGKTPAPKLTGFKIEVPWLQASIVKQEGDTWTIEVKKAAGAPAGNLQPKLFVETSDAHEPELSVPVFASVYSILQVNPNPIVLPVVKVGSPAGMPVTIAAWEPTENPTGEIEDGKFVMQQRDHRDALMAIEVTPKTAGVSTRLLRIYAGKDLEAEVPVIVRAEP